MFFDGIAEVFFIVGILVGIFAVVSLTGLEIVKVWDFTRKKHCDFEREDWEDN